MRQVVYTDQRGFIRRAILPDNIGDEKAEQGIPSGPPDLEQLDWEGIKREMHNVLAQSGLFEWNDLQRTQLGVQPALTVLKRHLIALYRNQIDLPE